MSRGRPRNGHRSTSSRRQTSPPGVPVHGAEVVAACVALVTGVARARARVPWVASDRGRSARRDQSRGSHPSPLSHHPVPIRTATVSPPSTSRIDRASCRSPGGCGRLSPYHSSLGATRLHLKGRDLRANEAGSRGAMGNTSSRSRHGPPSGPAGPRTWAGGGGAGCRVVPAGRTATPGRRCPGAGPRPRGWPARAGS
jgi:hypothetical protein